MQVNRLVVAGLTQQRDDPLAFAERVHPDQMTALREQPHRMQQLADLVRVRRVAKHGQAEGRLGDEQVATLRLERWAGRVGAALEVAGDDDPAAAVFDDQLGAAEHMSGRHQGQRHIPERDPLAVARRLQAAAGQLAIAPAHDRDRAFGREHMRVAGTGVVAVPVGDHRARHRLQGIDVEIAGLAIEPGRGLAQPSFRRRRKIRHSSDIGAQISSAESGRATLSSGWRSARIPIASSTSAAPTISAAPNR